MCIGIQRETAPELRAGCRRRENCISVEIHKILQKEPDCLPAFFPKYQSKCVNCYGIILFTIFTRLRWFLARAAREQDNTTFL